MKPHIIFGLFFFISVFCQCSAVSLDAAEPNFIIGNSFHSAFPSSIQIDGIPQLISKDQENISFIRFPIRLSAGSPVVDLSKIIIRIESGSSVILYQYQKKNDNEYPDSGNWTISQVINGNTDEYLENGELFDIGLALKNDLKESSIKIEILPVDLSSSTLIDFSIPSISCNFTSLITNPSMPERTNSVLIINGFIYGGWQDEKLVNITVPLTILHNGNSSVDLQKAKIIWNNFSGEPIVINNEEISYNTLSLLKPGDRTLIKINIPEGYQISAGKSFSIEIIPKNFEPIIIHGNLGSGYSGGLLLSAYWSESSFSAFITIQGIRQATSNLVLDGQLYGDGSPITRLTFYICVPEGGTSIDLSKIFFLYAINNGLPNEISSGLSGLIHPGERVKVELHVNGPSAGESFTLEIKPPLGASTLVSRTLSTAYNGGVII